MRKVMWMVCVCGLVLPGAARGELLWEDNFDSGGNLDHWTVTTGTGAISIEGDRMRLDAQGDPVRAVADYPMPYPADGVTHELYLSGLASPGRNAYNFLGAGPFEVVYFDIQEPFGYFRARFDGAYFGGPGGGGTDTHLPGADDVVDFRYVFTGQPGDQVEVKWQWKMSADGEYVDVENATQTVATADFPDLAAHVQPAWRGEGDSSIWYMDRAAFVVPEPVTIGLLVLAAPVLLKRRRRV